MSAPVTLTGYGDYECPSCATINPVVVELLKNYPDELKNLVSDQQHVKRLAALRASLAAELERTAAPAAVMPPKEKP